MIRHLGAKQILVPDGFATTAAAYRQFLQQNELTSRINSLIESLDLRDFSNLGSVSAAIKKLILGASIPNSLADDIRRQYKAMCEKHKGEVEVAFRSSATAEDLPGASFAGQHDSFLNIRGESAVVEAVKHCYASLYNARAIKYRIDNGFEHGKGALSAGIQRMVRSDLSSSGVCFTIDPETGFRNSIVITGCWGLGENIVQGAVIPNEFHVFKPAICEYPRCILSRKKGTKAKTLVYREQGSGTINQDTPPERQKAWTLNDSEIAQLAAWSVIIERHYGMPMDIEWARDGLTQELFIVQARPETVHGARDPRLVREYTVLKKGETLVTGNAVGTGLAFGTARILRSPSEADKLQAGEVLVTDITNPDWDPVMKKAAAIVTNKGGRTSHAAIVARELGALALVGAAGATDHIRDGDLITLDNSQGKTGRIYAGKAEWEERELDFRNVKMPRTRPQLIVADPDKANKFSFYPNEGVGLMRMDFVINTAIRIHPMALVRYDQLKDLQARQTIAELTEGYEDKTEYFVDKLAQATGTIAAAFYPKDVIVRMSDFKSNEYANLIGGREFELDEENPMIGLRGASRYYNDLYREGFRLECAAMKRVREEMRLKNVKLMIPFCRTVEEGRKVVELMETFGLRRGEGGLEIYVMADIPSNVILAEAFAGVYDGFSIGSNDLTQLTLGVDRDPAVTSDLFYENNPAVRSMIASVIRTAKTCGAKIGLCGQAPSDQPAFAAFLVESGIDSIAFNPDALLKGIDNMNRTEADMDSDSATRAVDIQIPPGV
jgi:pyruvate,water dikinase